MYVMPFKWKTDTYDYDAIELEKEVHMSIMLFAKKCVCLWCCLEGDVYVYETI